ncbi:MAG: hypothetical protein JWP36_2411 [Paucimonas sp.]|nr:hypothetical protein [Paucimonas sp.]
MQFRQAGSTGTQRKIVDSRGQIRQDQPASAASAARPVRALLCCLLALGAPAVSAQSARSSGEFTLQPENLRDSMVYQRWQLAPGQSASWARPMLLPNSMAPLDFPATRSAGSARSFGARNGADWHFSMEVRPTVEPGAQMAATGPGMPNSASLPLLGGVQSGSGNIFSGGLRKSFGSWSVLANVKQQESAAYGSFRKPALSILYRPEEGGALAGLSLSRSSRTPGFYASGHPFGGNNQAGAEKSEQAELFFANDERSPWRMRLTVFQAYYRDMMDFDGGPPPSLVNRARVYVRGVETSISRRWASGTQAYLHAASMASYDPDSGFDMRYRPRQQATGGFALPLAGPLKMHASLSWFGRRYDTAGSAEAVGSYMEAGMMLSWKTRKTQTFVAVDNLFDRRAEEYPQGFDNGRRLRLGWQSSF